MFSFRYCWNIYSQMSLVVSSLIFLLLTISIFFADGITFTRYGERMIELVVFCLFVPGVVYGGLKMFVGGVVMK